MKPSIVVPKASRQSGRSDISGHRNGGHISGEWDAGNAGQRRKQIQSDHDHTDAVTTELDCGAGCILRMISGVSDNGEGLAASV